MQETTSYKQAFDRLRDLKPQIEQLQSLLVRQQADRRSQQADLPPPQPPVARMSINRQTAGASPALPLLSAAAEIPAVARTSADMPSITTSATALSEWQLTPSPVGHSMTASPQQLINPPVSERRPSLLSDANRSQISPAQSILPLITQPSGQARYLLAAPMFRASVPQAPPPPDFSHVAPEVMEAAAPLLTGNGVADRNIVRFYEARAAMLRRQQALTGAAA